MSDPLDIVLAACAWYDAEVEERGRVDAPSAVKAAESMRDEILELRLTVAYYEGSR